MVTEDQTYKTAETILRAALGQHKVGMHGAAEAINMGDMDVAISGAPRSMSFCERKRDGKTGDNRETLSITFEPKLDLRAANDSDVRKAVMDTMQNLLSGEAFKLPDGKALAESYNWDQNNKQPEKIDPKFDIVNDGKDNKIHLFLDLPAGVTHWNTVDALAGKDTIKIKEMGEWEKKVTTAPEQPTPAQGAQNPTADAPALTPVGDATSKVAAERTVAANQDQARGVA